MSQASDVITGDEASSITSSSVGFDLSAILELEQPLWQLNFPRWSGVYHTRCTRRGCFCGLLGPDAVTSQKQNNQRMPQKGNMCALALANLLAMVEGRFSVFLFIYLSKYEQCHLPLVRPWGNFGPFLLPFCLVEN